MPQSFCQFETALGRLVIAWTEKGISCLQLAEETDEKTMEVFRKRQSNAELSEPNAVAKRAIQLLTEHLAGQIQDFNGIPLDLTATATTPFSRKVYQAAMEIKAGTVASYSDIASRIGSPEASRAVGRALGSNPIPIIIPCHRVIGKNGSMTGFSAHGSCNTKMRLLSIEKALSSDKVSLVGMA